MPLTTQMLIAEINRLKSKKIDPSVELNTPKNIPPENMSIAQLIAAFTQLVNSKSDELGIFSNGLRMISFQYSRNRNNPDAALQAALVSPVKTLNTRFDELVNNQAEFGQVVAALDNNDRRLFNVFAAKVMGRELNIPLSRTITGESFSAWMERGMEKLREAEAEQDETRKVEIQTETQYMMYGALFLLSEKQGLNVRKDISDDMPELGESKPKAKQGAAPNEQGEAQNEPQDESRVKEVRMRG